MFKPFRFPLFPLCCHSPVLLLLWADNVKLSQKTNRNNTSSPCKNSGIFCLSGRFALWVCQTETSVPPPSLPGRSSLFPIDDNLLDDGHGNQGVPGVLGSTNCYPHQNGERIERFSRKVFVGGLPPDIDEGKGKTQWLVPSSWSRATVCSLFAHLFSSRWNHLKLPPLRPPGGGLASQSWEQILLST